jgi:O-acetylserine/cysteine efflux transporter
VAGGLALTVWSALAVPVPALVLALAFHGWGEIVDGLVAFDARSAVSTLYTAALASLVGYGIFNSLLARNHAADVVPFVLLAPAVAMLSAALLLDQRPNVAESLGAVTMVGGVLLCTRRAPLGRGGGEDHSPGHSAGQPDPGRASAIQTGM